MINLIKASAIATVAASLLASTAFAAPPSGRGPAERPASDRASETARENANKPPKAERANLRGTITTVTGTALPLTLTVTPKKGAAATVKVTADTKCRARFGQEIACLSLAKDDVVLVHGTKAADGSLEAKDVRDFSVTRHAFPGKVKSVDATKSEFVLNGKQRRGDLTVKTSATTKWFLGGKEGSASFTDLCVGAKVTAFGVRHGSGSVEADRVSIAKGSLANCPPPAPPAPPATPPVTP